MLLSLLSLSGLSAVALFNRMTGPQLRKLPRGIVPGSNEPRINILIPARNEEHNIGACLESILRQDYPDYTVTVLDDQSTDRTAEIIKQYAAQDKRVRLIEGKPLPHGWIGKSWACQQLGDAADGEIFIFTDADTVHEPFAARHTAGWMRRYNTGLFSAFPEQRTVSLLEQFVVPFIDMLVYSLLPLRLVYLTRFPSIAGANGQWIAFSREAYEGIGGHAAVRNALVEDIELSREVKRKGFKAMTASGTSAVYCRMYRSSQEVWDGFSKNFYAIAGNNPFIFLAGIAFCSIAFLAPYVMTLVAPSVESIGLILANMAYRFALAVRYKHPIIASVLLHPIGVAVSIATALHSFFVSRRNAITWKNRHIDLNTLRATR